MKRDVLVVGCGYLGWRAAQAWQAAGCPVHATTRSPHRAAQLAASGLMPHVVDVTQPSSLRSLPAVGTVLWAVGWDRASGLPIAEVYVRGLESALAALPTSVERVIYISSTGVYGDAHGELLDETAKCAPNREGGRACLAAEQALAAATPWGARAIVLRLAGIYGPGRLPNRAPLAAGEVLPLSGESHLNLIHVHDAVRVVLAAAGATRAPRTFNVSDGSPCTRAEYYGELSRLLGLPAPRFAPAASATGEPRRGSSDKRIDSSRVWRELGLAPTYPDFRAGLAASVGAR